MSRKTRWVRIGAGLVLFTLFAIFAGPGLWARLFGPSVITNALVGQPESRVVREYGKPSHDWADYHALAHSHPAQLPVGPIRTLVFDLGGLFHLEGGTLYVWLYQKREDWVCFESCWFADTVNF